jgi:hypothetical protein
MRGVGGWKLEVALLVGLGVVSVASAQDVPSGAEEKPAATSRTGFQGVFRKWFGPPSTGTEKKPGARAEKDAAKKSPPAKAVVHDEAAVVRAREEAALLRRLAVCDRLKEIAYESGNEELQRKAEQLDQRAWAVYSQHTANFTPAGGRGGRVENALQTYARTPAEPTNDRAAEQAHSVGVKNRFGGTTAEEDKP